MATTTSPTTPLSGRIPPNEPDDARSLRDRVKDLLASSGMQEVVNYSLSDVKGLENAGLSTPGADEAVEGGEPAPCRAGISAS